MQKPVFISHSSSDASAATRLCEGLESRGLLCWIAPRDIPLGTTYGSAIMEGVRACEVLLVAVSEEAAASPEVEREVERASSYHKPIVPVVLTRYKPGNRLEYYLAGRQWLDASSGVDESVLDRLAAGIRDELKDAPVPSSVAVPRPAMVARRKLVLTAAIFSLLAVIVVAGLYFGGTGPDVVSQDPAEETTSAEVAPPLGSSNGSAERVPTVNQPAGTPEPRGGGVSKAPRVRPEGDQVTTTTPAPPAAQDLGSGRIESPETPVVETSLPAASAPTTAPPTPPDPRTLLRNFAENLENTRNITVARDLLSEVFRVNASGQRDDSVFAALRNNVANATADELRRAQAFMLRQE